jgi:hypothetical protein
MLDVRLQTQSNDVSERNISMVDSTFPAPFECLTAGKSMHLKGRKKEFQPKCHSRSYIIIEKVGGHSKMYLLYLLCKLFTWHKGKAAKKASWCMRAECLCSAAQLTIQQSHHPAETLKRILATGRGTVVRGTRDTRSRWILT